MKILFFLFLASLILFQESFSVTYWNLGGVKIIYRKEWEANNILLFSDYYIHKNYKPKINKKKQKIYTLRKKYLMKYFSNERILDNVKYYYLGKKLYWAFSYKFKKTKIIIHHTDSLAKKIKNYNDSLSTIKAIYKYHTITRHWGDIGYHFIIDPFGNIFEGKAGGEGIVGAHSKWNNPDSIGIALIGDFNIEKPTKKQIASLLKLTLALSKKYNINPYKYVTYHKEYRKYPYILNVKKFSIVGHKDTGYTSCPGANLYKLLPWLRKQISIKMNNIKNKKVKIKNIKKVDFINYQKKIKYLDFGKKISFSNELILKFKNNISYCKSLDSNFIVSCKKNILLLKKKTYGFLRKIKLVVGNNDVEFKVNLLPIFIGDLRFMAYNKAQKYHTNKNKTRKIAHKVYISKKLIKTPVKVLLYELSTKFTSYDIVCSNSCNIILDRKTLFNKKKFKIDKLAKLLLWIDGKAYPSNSITILGNGGEIIFKNYKRKSYAGIPWNSFKGNIAIKKDYIKLLGKGIKRQYVIINMLSLNDYLAGIAESNDQIPIEKSKVMSLLAKSYILFYLDKGNTHPSIPKKSKYNAIDDPRIFQKYVGVGYEKTSKKWKKVLNLTKNEYLVYSGYVPILPYFSCSKGYTLSAKQKFGRIDTPYLVNNLDLGKCNTFKGHGVGLSGKGAEFLAKKGFNYEQIINWYFPGVKIIKK